MPTQNFNLSDKQAEYIRQRVKGGDYHDASEVVRAGLRLLQRQEQQEQLTLRALRRLAKEGFAEIDQGQFQEVDPRSLEGFIDALGPRTGAGKS